jgi:hypothetical protein
VGTWVSKDGVWYPAKERLALKNLSGKVKTVDGKEVQPGDDYIYEGADRVALFELFKEGVETLGQDFRKNPEFLQALRNQGYQSVDEYLKAIGYSAEEVEAKFKANAAVVNKGDMKKTVKAIEIMGGGVDTAGVSKTRYGGFGPQPVE